MQYQSILGTVTRNSSSFIQEYLCYNYLLGYDKIVIGIDRCNDDTWDKISKCPTEVLSKVEIQIITASPYNQAILYDDIVRQYRDDATWLFMFDDDEYFYDAQNRSINEWLSTVNNNTGQVLLPAIEFGHNGHITSHTPILKTRIGALQNPIMIEPSTQWFKSVIRTNRINTARSDGWYRTHYGIVECGDIVDNQNRTITKAVINTEEIASIMRRGYTPSVFENFDTCIVHYGISSMEDYVNSHKKWELDSPSPYDYWDVRKAERTAKHFDDWHGENIKDTRMSTNVGQLKELLERCKR